MATRLLTILLMAAALFVWGCPKDDDENPPAPQEDAASRAVRSDDTTAQVITTPAGARMTIPPGAVPPRADGSAATMVFSVERANSIPVTPPAGEALATDIYRFGPEGFVLAAPVEIAIPVPGDGDPGDLAIYRVDPTTGNSIFYGGEYDPGTRTVKVSTYEFSPWYCTRPPSRNSAWGCVDVNNLSNMWVYVCVDQYTLTFPEQDAASMRNEVGGLWAPSGTIGWTNRSNFRLPQGSYRLCIQYQLSRDPWTYGHVFRDITVNSAYRWPESTHCPELTIGTPALPDTGRCTCIPTPTTPVGTGDIQVTLNWYNANALDLDLWVQDPTGEWCYYGNGQAPGTTSTGGQLDRDNLCSNYENGRPENIYWTQPPPVGEYIVAVDWYSSCSHEHGNQPYTVRTVVQGVTRTISGSIAPNTDMQEVTRFRIVGSTVEFLPPRADVVRNAPNKPPKN